MSTTTIRIPGRIEEGGRLEVTLPAGMPIGDVNVIIEIPINEQVEEDEYAWVEPKGQTAGEILEWLNNNTTGWEDKGITDSAVWVENLRRREEQRRHKG